MNICITWYIDCSSTFEDDFHDNTMVMWPLYEECIQGVDALTNDLDECQRALSEGETSRDSLILQVPQQYANCTLRPFMRVVVELSRDPRLDGYHTIPNLNDKNAQRCFAERVMTVCVPLVVIVYDPVIKKSASFQGNKLMPIHRLIVCF